MTVILALGASSAQAAVVFDGSPGTAAPPATLGPYTMSPYTDDPRGEFSLVTATSGFPGGNELGFSHAMDLRTVGSGWATWSHGYTGDVYFTGNGAANEFGNVTMTMPPNTGAIYFYAQPNPFASFEITATTDDGTTSGPVTVLGSSGATYYGFFATGTDVIESIAVTMDPGNAGMAVGEFGWAETAGGGGGVVRGGELSCIGSALVIAQDNVGPVANGPFSRPCNDDKVSRSTMTLAGGGGKVIANTLYAETNAVPDDPSSAPPALGDMGFAQASVAKLKIISSSGSTVVVRGIRSTTNAKCVADDAGGLEPALRSTSSVTGVTVNGVRHPTGTAAVDIPVPGSGTLRLNAPGQIYDNGARRQIVRTSVWLDQPGFSNDVQAARSKSDFSYDSSGNPCTT